MGCGSSSSAANPSKPMDPEQEAEMNMTGHSTGTFSQKLTKREWENLTYGTRSFINELDELRMNEKIKFDSTTIDDSENGGIKGNYVGETDENGKAHGEGTYLEKQTMKEYRGTFKKNKIYGWATFIGKTDKQQTYLRIGEIKDNVWMGKRTDYHQSGKITNKIYKKDPNPEDDYDLAPDVKHPMDAFFGTGKPNNKD